MPIYQMILLVSYKKGKAVLTFDAEEAQDVIDKKLISYGVQD